MGLGLGIVLILIGAVFSFTEVIEGAADMGTGALDQLGWIFMLVGLLSIVVGMIMTRMRANTSHTAVVERHETGDLPPEDRRRL